MASILSSSEKTDFHIHRWSNVLTACSGKGSVDDVIGMAWVGARILRGSNALQIVMIAIVAKEQEAKKPISIDVGGRMC